MTLPAGCFPCAPVVASAARHIARPVRHVARSITRPFHHPARHITHLALRHPGKIIIGVCCAGALGPVGGALPLPPPNLPAAIYMPPVAVANAAPPAQAWPEIPSYSGGSGIGPGGIYGNGNGNGAAYTTGSNAPAPIPVYGQTTAPTLIPIQPATNIPEPASFALLLLPAGIIIAIRRRPA